MWIELHTGLLTHPKVTRTASELGIQRELLVGHIVTLWLWVRSTSPDGNLESFDAVDIELACGWKGEPGMLHAALVARRWIDVDPHRVHDWEDYSAHMKDATRKRAERAAKSSIVHGRPRTEPDNNGQSADVRLNRKEGRNRQEPEDMHGGFSAKPPCSRQTDAEDLLLEALGPVEPPAYTMPCRDGLGELGRQQVEAWKAAYVAIDVEQEIAKISAWLVSNPAKAWTKKGLARGVNAWLNEAQNRLATQTSRNEARSTPGQRYRGFIMSQEGSDPADNEVKERHL